MCPFFLHKWLNWAVQHVGNELKDESASHWVQTVITGWMYHIADLTAKCVPVLAL